MKNNTKRISISRNDFKKRIKIQLSFIFLLLTIFQVKANSYSQNIKISISVTDISVAEVLELIEEKTKYKIFYKNSVLKSDRKVSLHVINEKLENVLKQIFLNRNVVYRFSDELIILSLKNDSENDQIQKKITISGTITDKNELPIPGVNIFIKNTSKGVTTDFDGNFNIQVLAGSILTFKNIGFKEVEIKVSESKILNLKLEESVESLKEVVISTGYGKVSKRTFTGASTTVNIEEMKIEGITDATRMLEGRVAGVNIQNVTGTFGAAPKITVRGSSSVFGNNSPLYVIDGVVQEDVINVDVNALTSGNAETLISSSIAGIDANSIKSVEILKDASATSLYGARARNGVVVITTKSGKRSSPLVVNYSLDQSVRDIPNYKNYDILDSKETISIYNELESKGFLELPKIAQARYGGLYYIMADRSNRINPETDQFYLQSTPEARNQFLKKYELANTDWFNTLFNRSMTQTHSVSLSGGGENNAIYGSIGYFTDPGWSIADKVNRIATNLKGTFYLSDKFKLTLSSIASIRKQKAPGSFDSKSDIVNGAVTRDFDINPFSYTLNTSRALRPKDEFGNLEYSRNNWAPFNILNEIENNTLDLSVIDIRFQADGEYKLSDNLKYNFSLSNRSVNSTFEHKVMENSNVVGAYNSAETTIVRNANIFLYNDPNNPTAPAVPVLPAGGIYNKTDYYLTSYYLRNSINYNNTFNDVHEFSGLLGQEMRFVNRNRNTFRGYGLQYDSGLVPFTDPRILEKLISDGNDYFTISEEKERTVAFYLQGNYTYDRKFTLSFTGRYDGSNRQGRSDSSRWLPTGTISGKWNVSEHDFMEDVEAINSLQFRASYGLVANPGSATNSLAIIKSLKTDRDAVLDREAYLNITELQNSELTWEKQYETNIGVNLRMFNNRVDITADVFKRDIFDNIDFVRTSGIGGQSIKRGNNATVDVKGLEFSISTKNITKGDFQWKTDFNFSHIKQKITKLANKPYVYELTRMNGGNVVGYPINSLFSFDFEGLNNRGLPTFNLPEDSTNPYNEVNGVDFQTSENILDYLVYEGSTDPTFNSGLTNSFKYKNWNLNVFISASGGNKIRLNEAFSAGYSDLNVFTKDFKNRWILAGDELRTNVPVIASKSTLRDIPKLSRAYNAYNKSTVRTADGSFIRLKNISLGYTFDADITKKLGLSSLKVKFLATNLLLLYSDDKLNGQDPEFFNTGGVAFPIKKQFTFSLNLSI